MKIYRNSVSYLHFHFPGHQASLDNLLDWLKTVALRGDSNISVSFQNLDVYFACPELVSTLRFFANDDSRLNEVAFQTLSDYCNLTVLDIQLLECSVDKLMVFPNLNDLSVGGLYVSKHEKCLTFSNVRCLAINNPENSGIAPLPGIIQIYFPSLVYFKLWSKSMVAKEKDIDFSELPCSCKFLTTDVVYLGCFTNCKHIENVNVLYRYDDNRDSIRYLLLSPLNLKLLKIDLDGPSMPSTRFLQLMTFMLSNLKLEVLCSGNITLCERLTVYGERAESVISTHLDKMIEGAKNCDPNSFFEEQQEIRDLCRSNDQLKVLGFERTLLVRKTVNAAFIRKLDDIDFEYGWNLRPANSSIFPIFPF